MSMYSTYLSATKSSKLAHIQVLIIDSDLNIASLLRKVLNSLGFGGIHAARNGEEALEIINTQHIDMAICEWDMSPMNGLEFLDALRKDNTSPNRLLPVIMLTGKAQREYVEKARDAGITEFLVKPFTVRTLCDRILLVVEHPRNFIMSNSYVGPDRRRKQQEPPQGVENRRADLDDTSLVVSQTEKMKVIRVQDEDVTIVDPDYTIKEKIGYEVSLQDIFSQENVQRAQRIINNARGDFLSWVVEDMRAIETAYDTLESDLEDTNTKESMAAIALHIKAQAGTFGFDLASQVAESLTGLCTSHETMSGSRLRAARKHIDALYVIFQRNIQGNGGIIGRDLLESLGILGRNA